MKIINEKINVFGSIYQAELMKFDASDKTKWRELWESWKTLREGLLEYKSRGPNLSEGLSETAFCIATGSVRVIDIKGPSSFDTYNLSTGKAEQIKATSIEEDVSTFGPESQWDDLYFLDFYREGKMDGSFDIYLIDENLLYNHIVNKGKNETFKQQQEQKRRPRLSLKKIIKANSIAPIQSNVII